MGGQRRQHGVAAGAAAGDRHPVVIDESAAPMAGCHGDAILDIDDTPLPVELAPIFRAEPGRAAVIDVEHSETTAGPILNLQVQAEPRLRGRAAMDLDDQRRQLAVRRLEIQVRRHVTEGEGHAVVRGREADAIAS